MGQGRENARQFLKENKDIRQEIETRLRQGLGLPVLEPVPEPVAAAGGRSEKGGSVVPMPEKKKQA
jgi:recombination protein RecA